MKYQVFNGAPPKNLTRRSYSNRAKFQDIRDNLEVDQYAFVPQTDIKFYQNKHQFDLRGYFNAVNKQERKAGSNAKYNVIMSNSIEQPGFFVYRKS